MRYLMTLTALLVGYIYGQHLTPSHNLVVVAQNEATCQGCGARTIITIREEAGE